MHAKKLFICGTPLQALIIERIIELESIPKQNCVLFFYTYVENEKYLHAYERMIPLFSENHYYFCNNKFPGYAVDARKIFSSIDYQTVYFASAVSSFVLLALSTAKKPEIITFDDGTANISPNSLYASKYGITLKKAAALALFGNRYHLHKIRNESLRHYTLYPNIPNNISDNPTPITVIDALREPTTEYSCSLILGTVFGAAFPARNTSEILSRLGDFASRLDGDVFYLPHPRSKDHHVDGPKTIDTHKVAEEVIGDLCDKYRRVHLYGFCSSAQMNLGYSERIRNYLLVAEGHLTNVHAMKATMRSAGLKAHGVIDLDRLHP